MSKESANVLHNEVKELMNSLNSSNFDVSVEDQKKALKKLEEKTIKLICPDNRWIALELDVVPLLFKFLDSPNSEIKKDTLLILLQYVKEPEFTEVAVANDAISKLLKFDNLPNCSAEIAFYAMCILKFVIQKSVKGRELIIEAGISPSVLSIIEDVPDIDNEELETVEDIYTQRFTDMIEAFNEFNTNSEINYKFSTEQLKNAFESMSNMEKAMLDFSKIATQNPEESQAWKALTAFAQQGITPLYSLIGFLQLSNPTPAEIKGIVDILPLILTFFENPDNGIKHMIARLMAYLSNTEHKIWIRQANGELFLLKMLNSDDIALQYLAAQTFQNLNLRTTADLQAQINAAIESAPLIKLLESSKIEQVLNVIETLEITARENKSEAFKAKVIDALMNILKSKNNLIRFPAATAVISITRECENRSAILEAAIPILSEEIQCRKFNLKSLLTIFDCFKKGKNEEIQLFIDAKGIPALIKLLKSETEQICILSATLIVVFMFEKTDKDEMQPSSKRIDIVVQSGIVTIFVEFLKAANISLQMIAVEGLAAITYGSDEHKEAVSQANAIPSILKLLHHENILIRLNAIKAITKLSMAESEECMAVLKSLGEVGENKVEIEMQTAISAGIFSVLLKYLDSTNQDIRLEAIYTLLQFVKVPEFSKIAVEAGVIPPLIKITKLPDTLTNSSIAAFTLVTLKFLVEYIPNVKELAIQAGASPIIIQGLPFIPELFDRKSVHLFDIIKNLMESPNEAANRSSASEHLKYLFDSISDNEVKETVEEIIKNSGGTALNTIIDLTQDPNPCAYKITNAVKTGVVSQCVKLLEHDFIVIKHFAIHALNIINNGEVEHRHEIINANGVPSLLKMLNSDDIVLRYLAAHLLSNLNHPETSEFEVQINQAKAFLPLIKLLESPNTDFFLIIKIMEALGITADSTNGEPVEILLKLLNSDNDFVRLNAAKTLFKFTLDLSLKTSNKHCQLEAADSKNITSIMKAIIQVLIEYIQSEDAELFKDAYRIFCIIIEQNNDNDEVKNFIVDANGVAAIFKALNSNDSQLYANCSIEKLCYEKLVLPNFKVIDAFVDAGAIFYYLKCLDSPDPNLRQTGFSGLNTIAKGSVTHIHAIIDATVVPAINKILEAAFKKYNKRPKLMNLRIFRDAVNILETVLQKSLPEQKQILINSGAAELLTEYRRIEKIEMDAIAETVSEDEEEEEELE